MERAYPEAINERRSPSSAEIMSAHLPYFDAFIEEVLRVGSTIPDAGREAIRDTTVLGHDVPKGTLIVMVNRGPGYTEPAINVDESKRSKTSQATKDRSVPEWDEEDMGLFRPERWLTEENGELVFNSNAGPFMAFSGGIRGCFGKRLAYVELKVFFTLLVWNFDFIKLTGKFTGDEAFNSLTRAPKKDYISLRVREH